MTYCPLLNILKPGFPGSYLVKLLPPLIVNLNYFIGQHLPFFVEQTSFVERPHHCPPRS